MSKHIHPARRRLSLMAWAALAAFSGSARALSPALPPAEPPEPFATQPAPQTLQLSQVGQMAQVRIIDRRTGQALPIYLHQGEYWVAGQAGTPYAIAVQKSLRHGRTLGVMSVDGINIISGQTAAWSQTGYVFYGMQSYEITGWRKSTSEVAAFAFGVPEASYAARTGRPGHVGVIGVALFSERVEPARPEPRVAPPMPAPSSAPAPAGAAVRESRDEAQPAAPAPRAEGLQGRADASEVRKAAPEERARGSMAPGLGTVHGARETSVTRHVDFRRASERPDEIITIRYDTAENLARRGILVAVSSWPQPQPQPRPFPQSAGFVPDPPPRY